MPRRSFLGHARVSISIQGRGDGKSGPFDRFSPLVHSQERPPSPVQARGGPGGDGIQGRAGRGKSSRDHADFPLSASPEPGGVPPQALRRADSIGSQNAGAQFDRLNHQVGRIPQYPCWQQAARISFPLLSLGGRGHPEGAAGGRLDEGQGLGHAVRLCGVGQALV